MKDGSTTSFIIATRPKVSVNMVLSLLLIIATSIIINFVDTVVEVKRLNCPPFKIDFCRATKTIPATDDEASTTHYIKFENVLQILQKSMPTLQECANNFSRTQFQRPNYCL
jgi:hypothetical protein